ncbi:beta strand repeat-containing protein [Candidatus Finniella inopinata]|uniref:Uncharacterized protein n=1 Tax=Candidatus Finniella inopinata TaxID=1696036 RepID=A0A4Q7DMU8_9PROT|nr:hypothetical protein [Candidatus Finniella inopinata]RZI46156.1 hypothetical protein EQU50_04265 [Candidatus Finniella inopinata]
MRFSFVYMGLYAGMGVFSSVCVGTVSLQGDTRTSNPYPTISAAILAAPSATDPNITLTSANDSETATSNLSDFLTVGITGMATGTTISPSPAGSIFPLFTRTFTSASGSLTISNLIISGFKSNSSGGAIAVTNNVGSGKIIALTDTRFIGNSTPSGTPGGAVYLDGTTTLNYGVSGVKTITLNPAATSPTLGDNDIACSSGNLFTKLGSGELVLNTNNANWLGSTNINEGAFIVGDSVARQGAIWGATTFGAFTVGTGSSKATLGGYGTVNASSLTFGANSIWRILVGGSAGSHGTLYVGSGGLTLTPGMQVQIDKTGTTSFPDKYTIATCGSGLRGAGNTPFANMLAALNAQLTGYNLSLSTNGQNLLLQQNTVTLQDPTLANGLGTSYANIYSALAAADRASAPILFPRANVHTESVSSDPSLFTGVTITSSELGGTTISPATLGAFALFDSSASADSTAQNLTLSNVTVQGFKAVGTSKSGYATGGGAITTTSDDSYVSTKTVNLIASGPVNFSRNDASPVNVGGGAIFANIVTISGSANRSVTFTDNQAAHGGAICTRRANATADPDTAGTVNLNTSGSNFVPVTFNGNKAIDSAEIGGGAICTGSLNAGGTSPLTFSGNTAASRGGAVYTVVGVIISCPTTFKDNNVPHLYGVYTYGGAIFSAGNVSLTDTQFINNSAATGGGAVFMNGQEESTATFTYTVTNSKIITLNPPMSDLSFPAIDHDTIACSSTDAHFVKEGTGTLILNTNNIDWKGNTTVKAGAMIVGGTSANVAFWGTTDGTIIVKGGAIFGGYGYINAKTVTFEANSIWWLVPTDSDKGLQMPGTSGSLTLNPSMKVQLGAFPYPFANSGYTVAKYGKLRDSNGDTAPADSETVLAPLNDQLVTYGLQLKQNTINGSPATPYYSLILQQVATRLYLGSPPVQNVLVTFDAPGGKITRYGQGLVVWYGMPGTDGNFFGGALSCVALNNRAKMVRSTDGSASSSNTVTPWSWTGSAALPIGKTYAWQLWKSKYGETPTYSISPATNWIAQGQLSLTDSSVLSLTYQITPGEKS